MCFTEICGVDSFRPRTSRDSAESELEIPKSSDVGAVKITSSDTPVIPTSMLEDPQIVNRSITILRVVFWSCPLLLALHPPSTLSPNRTEAHPKDKQRNNPKLVP